ncbi:MAG: phage tail protein I [Rhizobiaceae bacterium]|nr:phage tail protein I [Rhizobiaceae bacterium]
MGDPSSILPPNAMPFERAIEQVSAERWDRLDVDIIRRARDPWTCPEHLLSFLAFEHSVDLWDETWPSEKKRSVIAAARGDHHLKGTEEGHRRYIAHAGGELVETLVPPGGFFLAPDLTKQQWDGWISRMPRLRITLAHGTGEWTPPDGFFLDACALDVDAPGINDGPALHGRRALLRRHAGAPDEPLRVAQVSTRRSVREAVDFERVVVPGLSTCGFALDVSGLDMDFVDVHEARPQVFSYRLDSTYVHEESELSLTSVPVGFDPLDVRFLRESDIGDGRGQFFLGVDALDDGFLGRNDGGELLADVLYLHDPDVAAPIVDAFSFLDVTRLGFPEKTAEMMILAERELPADAFVLDQSFLGQSAMLDDDLSHVEFVMDAVVASKRLTDKLGVTFETTGPITLGHGRRLDQPLALNARIPNHL